MLWLALFLTFALTVDANRWVMTVRTDNQWMAGYVGDVTVCFTYYPAAVRGRTDEYLNDTTTTTTTTDRPLTKREECQSLPIRRFVRGKTYMFELELYEVVHTVEQVKLFGKPAGTSVCKRKSNMDSWHVRDISFHDMTSGRLLKVVGHHKSLLIETRCSEGKELILDKFNVTVEPRPCVMDGVIHRSGDRFDDGCSGVCRCEDGGVSCVSMCPPSIAVGCREIYVPGQCCQNYICENSPYAPKRCPVYEEDDCETANRTVGPGEFPWTAFIKLCDKKDCKRFCSGAIINDRWVMTAADCLRSVSNVTRDVRVIVGENSIVLSEDYEVEMAVESVAFSNAKQHSEQIALIKLRDHISFDQTVQPALLPNSREQCQVLSRPRCAATMTGWVNVGVENQQYEMYQLSVNLLDGQECDANVTIGRKRRPLPPSFARGMCVDLSNDELPTNAECGNCQPDNGTIGGCPSDKNWYLCTGERGRVLTSKLAVPTVPHHDDQLLEVNYVIGVVSYQLAADQTLLDICKKPAFKMAVNICNDLDWISDVTNNYYY